MKKEMMNIREAADYTGIDEIDLWRLADKDEMPVIKDRWHWKFDKSAIDEWMKKKSGKSD